MSDVFHAIPAGEHYTLPVSAKAQPWLMSVRRCVANLAHALTLDGATLPEGRTVTLPAVRVSLETLAAEIAAQSAEISRLLYVPDPALEAAFGAHPRLTAAARRHRGLRR